MKIYFLIIIENSEIIEIKYYLNFNNILLLIFTVA